MHLSDCQDHGGQAQSPTENGHSSSIPSGEHAFRAVGRLEPLIQRDTLRIEERGTQRYASSVDAQDAALPLLADALAQMIRSGLDRGQYIAENGVVQLREEVSHE